MKLQFEGTATLEAFRNAVLKALDTTAGDLFGEKGWADQELPELFKTIDKHTIRLAERFGIELTED